MNHVNSCVVWALKAHVLSDGCIQDCLPANQVASWPMQCCDGSESCWRVVYRILPQLSRRVPFLKEQMAFVSLERQRGIQGWDWRLDEV